LNTTNSNTTSATSKFRLAINRIDSGVDSVISKFQLAGMVGVFSMMALTFVDVILRYIFGRPIYGSNEITRILLLLLVMATIAYGQVTKGHVAVTALVDRLPKGVRSVLMSTTTLLSLFLFSLIVWQNIVWGIHEQSDNIRLMITQLPVYPFYYFIAFGCAMLSLVLVRDFFKYLFEARNHSWEVWLRAIVAGSMASLAGIAIWFSKGLGNFEPAMIGILGFILMLIFLFAGQPVGFAMALAGLVGVGYIRGLLPSMHIAGTIPFKTLTYIFSVIPLFMLMGQFAYNGGLSGTLYAAAHKLVGRLRGGLAVANILASVGFGAICGDPVAGCMAMGSVATPEMKKFNYHPSLITGTIVTGGTLSALIPPSMILIIYGILTQISVGKLFIGGILPGILNATLFTFVIYVQCWRNPSMGPAPPSSSFKEKLSSIKGAWPAMVLFIVVMGGIYGGVFTPTEAGGVGAAGALLISLAIRRMDGKGIITSLRETTRMASIGISILIGAGILNYFLGISQLPLKLAEWAAGLPVSPVVVLVAIILIYFILGTIMPGMAMVIMTIPIFFPIILALGFDPIWFGIIVTLMMNVGGMTPPVGMLCYFVSGASGVPLPTVFRGVLPFLAAFVVSLTLLIAFPQIVTTLPNMMG